MNLIACMDRNQLIGINNKLPWYFPEDLKKFRVITMGGSLIMGRKTWESLPGFLPGRQCIVLTRNPEYKADGCDIVPGMPEAIKAANSGIFFIGGAEIFKLAMPLVDRMYLTVLHKAYPQDGDCTYFPKYDSSEWNTEQVERGELGSFYELHRTTF